MNKKFGRATSLFLACCLVAGMASCSNSVSNLSDSSSLATSSVSEDSSSDNPYAEQLTIELFTETGNYNGELVGWGAKLLKDKFNVVVNITSTGGNDTVFQTKAVSGDLGDIVVFGSNTQHFTDSIESGLLLDWTKDDLLSNHGSAISVYTDAIDKMKNTYGDGTAVYGMFNNVSSRSAITPSEATELTYGSFMRTDLYQSIGSPTISSLDDLYPVLKQMAEANPTTEDGSKVYVFSLFGSWDGAMMSQAKQFGCLYGYDEISGGSAYILQNADASDYQSIFDPEGYYVKGLKIYNQAYRDGLLDPDSLSQDFDTLNTKVTNGQVLYVWWSWLAESYNSTENTSQGKGMYFVPIEDEKIVSTACRSVGSTYKISLGADCQDPERCMDIINWMYTPEGMMTLKNGPEGLTWTLEDGKPVFTDYGLEVVPNNSETEVPEEYGGGNYKGGGIGYLSWEPVLYTDINPETGDSYSWQAWSSYLNSKASGKDEKWNAFKNWSEMLGTTSQKEYCVEHNQISVIPSTSLSVPTLDSDLSAIQSQVQTTVRDYSWQMVYANSDEEFNSLLATMTEKCTGFGVSQLDEFYVNYLLDLSAENTKVVAAAQGDN